MSPAEVGRVRVRVRVRVREEKRRRKTIREEKRAEDRRCRCEKVGKSRNTLLSQ